MNPSYMPQLGKRMIEDEEKKRNILNNNKKRVISLNHPIFNKNYQSIISKLPSLYIRKNSKLIYKLK